MRIAFIGLVLLIVFLRSSGFAEDLDKENVVPGGIAYKQQEFQKQLKELSSKEHETAETLNREIDIYNENPTVAGLQIIEDLKMGIIENLQDQIRNDRDYIAYLELKLSEMSNYRFAPLGLAEEGILMEEEEVYEDFEDTEEDFLDDDIFLDLEEDEDEEIEADLGRDEHWLEEGEDEGYETGSGEGFDKIRATANSLLKEVAPLRFGEDVDEDTE